MKLMLTRVGVRLAVAAAIAVFSGSVSGAEDINQVFQMGKAAYYKGDFETAYRLLQQVEARHPSHFETKALMAQIRSQMKSTGGSSLKKTYEGVVIPKLDFADVSLTEAVEGLRGLSSAATGGKVMPNIIVKDPALGSKTFSLNLRNVPLTQAIQYLAEMTGAHVSYDTHAVIFNTAPASSSTVSIEAKN